MDISVLASLLAWGVFVGVVFSAIGAAGGILTSFGLISLFGMLDPNAVKPMTQIVVLATALTFVPGYLRRRAIVLPLGLLLGAGGLVGAFIGSTLSSRYLSDMATFQPLFGILTLAVAAQIIWKLTRGGKTTGPVEKDAHVSKVALNLKAIRFSYGTQDFRVPLWSPLLAGLLISMIAAIFGVGGGFLLVPYMATLLGMPMYIIPATAAIAIFMSLGVSISNFLALGATLNPGTLGPLLAGAFLGAIIGPMVNRRLKNAWLQAILAVVVTGIGVKYLFF